MIENREVKIAKQFDDVMVLVVKLVKTIKAKGDYAALVPELIDAVSGVEEIPAELKADMFACINTALLRGTEIAEIFVPVKKEEE